MKLSLFGQPQSAKLLFALYVPTGMILLATFIISVQTNTPLYLFTRDPADIVDVSPFLGVLSNFGVLLWCSAAAICFFAFFVVKEQNPGILAIFFLFSGLITSMLLLDDFFLLHERIYPHVFGWRQRYIYLSYVSIVLGYLIVFRKIIVSSNVLVLALAFGFFFLSILVDGIVDLVGDVIPFYHLYEDGFKLFGLASWLGYFGQTALHAVSRPAER